METQQAIENLESRLFRAKMIAVGGTFLGGAVGLYGAATGNNLALQIGSTIALPSAGYLVGDYNAQVKKDKIHLLEDKS